MSKLNLNSGMDPIIWWNKLKGIPGGKWAFSKGLGYMVPYTGTINAQVLKLQDGISEVIMPNVKKNRNHMGTVHAVAMMNLMELSASLALLSRKEEFDCCVTELNMRYIKPAKGKVIYAYANVQGSLKKIINAHLYLYDDKNGKPVAKGICTWRIWEHED